MGLNQSSPSNQSKFLSEWTITPHTHNRHPIWTNNIDPNMQLEEHTIYAESDDDNDLYKRLYLLRRNSPELVNAWHMKEIQPTGLCNVGAQGQLYVEKMPLTLEEIQHVPYPDSLHLMFTALAGYRKLFREIGVFKPLQSQIGFMQTGEAKVWLDSNFAAIKPWMIEHSEQSMVHAIVLLIEDNMDNEMTPKEIPSLKQFIYHQKETSLAVTFDEALIRVREYANKYNDGGIPKHMECIRQVGVGNILQSLEKTVSSRKPLETKKGKTNEASSGMLRSDVAQYGLVNGNGNNSLNTNSLTSKNFNQNGIIENAANNQQRRLSKVRSVGQIIFSRPSVQMNKPAAQFMLLSPRNSTIMQDGPFFNSGNQTISDLRPRLSHQSIGSISGLLERNKSPNTIIGRPSVTFLKGTGAEIALPDSVIGVNNTNLDGVKLIKQVIHNQPFALQNIHPPRLSHKPTSQPVIPQTIISQVNTRVQHKNLMFLARNNNPERSVELRDKLKNNQVPEAVNDRKQNLVGEELKPKSEPIDRLGSLDDSVEEEIIKNKEDTESLVLRPVQSSEEIRQLTNDKISKEQKTLQLSNLIPQFNSPSHQSYQQHFQASLQARQSPYQMIGPLIFQQNSEVQSSARAIQQILPGHMIIKQNNPTQVRPEMIQVNGVQNGGIATSNGVLSDRGSAHVPSVSMNSQQKVAMNSRGQFMNEQVVRLQRSSHLLESVAMSNSQPMITQPQFPVPANIQQALIPEHQAQKSTQKQHDQQKEQIHILQLQQPQSPMQALQNVQTIANYYCQQEQFQLYPQEQYPQQHHGQEQHHHTSKSLNQSQELPQQQYEELSQQQYPSHTLHTQDLNNILSDECIPEDEKQEDQQPQNHIQLQKEEGMEVVVAGENIQDYADVFNSDEEEMNQLMRYQSNQEQDDCRQESEQDRYRQGQYLQQQQIENGQYYSEIHAEQQDKQEQYNQGQYEQELYRQQEQQEQEQYEQEQQERYLQQQQYEQEQYEQQQYERQQYEQQQQYQQQQYEYEQQQYEQEQYKQQQQDEAQEDPHQHQDSNHHPEASLVQQQSSPQQQTSSLQAFPQRQSKISLQSNTVNIQIAQLPQSHQSTHITSFPHINQVNSPRNYEPLSIHTSQRTFGLGNSPIVDFYKKDSLYTGEEHYYDQKIQQHYSNRQYTQAAYQHLVSESIDSQSYKRQLYETSPSPQKVTSLHMQQEHYSQQTIPNTQILYQPLSQKPQPQYTLDQYFERKMGQVSQDYSDKLSQDYSNESESLYQNQGNNFGQQKYANAYAAQEYGNFGTYAKNSRKTSVDVDNVAFSFGTYYSNNNASNSRYDIEGNSSVRSSAKYNNLITNLDDGKSPSHLLDEIRKIASSKGSYTDSYQQPTTLPYKPSFDFTSPEFSIIQATFNTYSSNISNNSQYESANIQSTSSSRSRHINAVDSQPYTYSESERYNFQPQPLAYSQALNRSGSGRDNYNYGQNAAFETNDFRRGLAIDQCQDYKSPYSYNNFSYDFNPQFQSDINSYSSNAYRTNTYQFADDDNSEYRVDFDPQILADMQILTQ